VAKQEGGTPGWLWAIGVVAVAAIGGALVFAVGIGISNFDRIGV